MFDHVRQCSLEDAIERYFMAGGYSLRNARVLYGHFYSGAGTELARVKAYCGNESRLFQKRRAQIQNETPDRFYCICDQRLCLFNLRFDLLGVALRQVFGYHFHVKLEHDQVVPHVIMQITRQFVPLLFVNPAIDTSQLVPITREEETM